MARIRSIKPEFWTSLQVAERSPTVRLLFIGTWTFSDDRGVHPWSAKQIKMEVFPGDDFTISDVDDMLTELWRADLIQKFDTDDGTFFVVSGWHHQKIERPNPKYPNPSDYHVRRWIDDHSPNVRRPFDDRSSLIGGIGEEGSGEESSCVELCSSPPAEQDQQAILTYPTVGNGKTWGLTQTDVDQFAECYPGVDVLAECRKALAWCHANPKQRKTAGGMLRFLNGWLGKEQNRSRGSPNGPTTQTADEKAAEVQRIYEERKAQR